MSKNSIHERVNAERIAHTDHDILKKSYDLKNRFHHIWKYPSKLGFDSRFHHHLQSLSDKVILDYGCGRGSESLKYLGRGATVYGIDISEVYIRECEESAIENGFRPDRFHFKTMDAHSLEFPDETFDIVAGNGILHHLDPEIAMSEIYRVLKPGGRVLLQEPLADNPLLKLFRYFTPSARTDDERPFTRKDIAILMDKDRWIVQSYYCGLIEAPTAILTSVLFPSQPDNAVLKFAHILESRLRRSGWLNSWHQYVLFNLIKKG